VLNVRLPNAFQPELFNELRDVVKTGPHVGGQPFKLLVHNLIQGFYGPTSLQTLVV